jgi:tetratricopeptide (TPR) repeat protein
LTKRQSHRTGALRFCIFAVLTLGAIGIAMARPRPSPPPRTRPSPAAIPAKKLDQLDDSLNLAPAKDLVLRPEGEHKAEALAHFVEGITFEENGEMEKALDAYRKVLNVDPGQAELATRVAALLTRQDDFPQAIDILKDAIKASPNASEPYMQLAFIYAKYLKKTDQAIEYANRAVALDPHNIEAYQRLCEIELAAGDGKKARESLDRAAKVDNTDPSFWSQLGKLYASIVFKPNSEPKPEDLARVNQIFKRAVENAGDDATILKDVADYYAASRQIKEAIPLYIRVLELQPDDAGARERLATGFMLTNQRDKAVEMLEEIIKLHPDKYQSYELLGQLLEDNARALDRANQKERAKAEFAKAAANYEQSLLINPGRATTTLRLAELLIGAVRDSDRAVKLLTEGRRRFPGAPEFTYLLAIALRETKHAQEAVVVFEEALHEGEAGDSEIVNARFYFDYGATAEQAGLYDKAADLFRKSISLDPANAADAYNYLGYMWAEQNSHLDEAEAMVRHALQIEPNNGAYLDSLGWIEFRQGKFDQALGDLLRAAQNMTRDDAVVFEHIGDTYMKMNKSPQALEAWQKAAAIDPQNKKLADKIDNMKTKMSKGQPANANPIQ